MLLIFVDGEWILSIAFWNSVVGILPKPEQVCKLGLLQASSETSIHKSYSPAGGNLHLFSNNSPVKETF